MMVCAPFAPGDLAELVPQAEQAGPVDTSAHHGAELIGAGPCFSIRDGGGRLMLVGGFIEQPFGKAHAWARLAGEQGAAMVGLTRMVRRIIDATDYRRLEMVVRTGFAQGHEWAVLLGFAREGTLHAWGPAGEDFDMYARIRDRSAWGVTGG